MRFSQTLAMLLLAAIFAGDAEAGDSATFVPPKEFREIMFPEHGGGPARLYQAEEFAKILDLYESENLKIVFSLSKPPTTATPTLVAGLFVLEKSYGSWIISDSRRFEAAGKDSEARAEATQSPGTQPHISLVLFQGGRGHSFAQSASYRVDDGKFIYDLPAEKPFGEPDGAAPPDILVQVSADEGAALYRIVCPGQGVKVYSLTEAKAFLSDHADQFGSVDTALIIYQRTVPVGAVADIADAARKSQGRVYLLQMKNSPYGPDVVLSENPPEAAQALALFRQAAARWQIEPDSIRDDPIPLR